MITIRQAETQDAEQIALFQIEMAWETESMRLELPTVRMGVKAIFSNDALGKYYVACRDHVVLGCLLAQGEWSDWRNRTTLWIHSVYVRPDERGQGIFKAMYSHLKQLVEEDDRYAGLRLYVDKGNRLAQQVYQAQGMTDEHYALFEWMKED